MFQVLAPVFTSPSFVTHQQIFLGWLMCLGRHTEFQTFEPGLFIRFVCGEYFGGGKCTGWLGIG